MHAGIMDVGCSNLCGAFGNLPSALQFASLSWLLVLVGDMFENSWLSSILSIMFLFFTSKYIPCVASFLLLSACLAIHCYAYCLCVCGRCHLWPGEAGEPHRTRHIPSRSAVL